MDSQGKPLQPTARTHIPVDVETTLLADKSLRRCCVCFGLDGDTRPKRGQIAHLDKNPANPTLDNPLCVYNR